MPRPPEAVLQVHMIEMRGLTSKLFRVDSENAHGNPLIAAVVGTTIVRLGGFEAPDLYSLDSAEPSARDSMSLGRLAEAYAIAGDPFGGLFARVCAVAGEGEPRSPAMATKGVDGSWSVSVLMCTRSISLGKWERHRYSFMFSSDGKLVAWHRHREP